MDRPLTRKIAAPHAATSLTVVVPVYGPGPHLEEVIEALRRQSPPVERIIVSHSGEGDPTSRLAGRGVEVLHSDARLFAGAARNRGLELATTDWVAFIDEDVIIDDGWHAALQAAIRRGEADCVVGSVGWADKGGYWGMSVWFVEFGSIHPYLARRAIAGGASANMAVRRDLFRAIGGFPEDWRMAEDTLAQARLIESGHAIQFEPDLQVRHFNLPGLRRMLRHMYDHGRYSAKIRPWHPNLSGGLAVRWPVLSLGLWLARLTQTYLRVLRARKGPVASLIVYTPGILLGLLAWNGGFAAEAFANARWPMSKQRSKAVP